MKIAAEASRVSLISARTLAKKTLADHTPCVQFQINVLVARVLKAWFPAQQPRSVASDHQHYLAQRTEIVEMVQLVSMISADQFALMTPGV